jgi:hypothetical protein
MGEDERDGSADPRDEVISDEARELDRLRAENARLRAEVDDDLEARDRRRAVRRRAITAVAFLVLGSILLPVSVLTVWTRNLVLDTDRYVETVTPLATDPAVVSALSARISNRVSDEIDVRSLAQEALPENAAFLAAPIAAGADNLIRQATDRLLASDRFEQAWINANRLGHEGLVTVLTGSEGDVVSIKDGKVVLQLGGLAQEVLAAVDRQFGTDLASRIPTERLDVDFVLVDSAQLADVQAAVRMLDRLAWFSVVLALGFLALSIAVAPDRRKAVLRVGAGVALSMLVLFLGFALGRDLYLTNLPEGVERPDVAAVFFDTLTRLVLQGVRLLFVLGVVVMAGAWLVGPSSAAARLRGLWDRVLGRGATMTGEAVDLGPVPAWISAHLAAVRWGIVGAAVLVLIWWDRPTGRVVLFLALATLVPLAIVQLLAGAAHRPDEDDPGQDTGGAAPAEVVTPADA